MSGVIVASFAIGSQKLRYSTVQPFSLSLLRALQACQMRIGITTYRYSSRGFGAGRL